ncbi:MAG: deoxyguanosinetriphosphate triphosphohydrolase [Xanthobacteraceae bacterium]|nr:MAG: deoxyguanosinetriphosphate triphosphohydrolase [Xanthobacteraceae bacterium]
MAIGRAAPRAPFASDPDGSRGRLHGEPPSRSRSVFRRDCDRVIHSTAFRRLKHKTQVFVFHEGDHYRTRLTHSLEVAQIARALARVLGLDEDLTEALALAHDLGHPPFGHAGERALDQCLAGHGGFDHNAQTLRVVTHLERRYPGFDGLNLSWETLEGIVKHNGPLTARDGTPLTGGDLPWGIADYAGRHDLELWSHAGLEAQVAALADDIAYDAHDIDDGLRAGLFEIDDLAALPLAGDIVRGIARRFPALDHGRRGAELVRELISNLIEDVEAETRRRLDAARPGSAEAVRRHGAVLAAFSPAMAEAERAIKAFLRVRMYRHDRVMRVMNEAESVVRALFAHYAESPADLPAEWWSSDHPTDARTRARLIGDFIAGMTDRYALIEHDRLFDSTPDLR